MGGMRGVAFGSLLGLSNFRKDAYAAGLHAYMIQKKISMGRDIIFSSQTAPIYKQCGK